MKYKKILDKQILETILNITAMGSFLFLLIIALLFLNFNTKLSLILIIGLIIIETIGALFKIFFFKKRPDHQKYSNLLEKVDAGSFPSIHSARIVLLVLSIYHFYTSLFILIFGIVMILLVGYSRISLKRHYLIDILFGYLMGVIITCSLWYLI
ncbi:MAG: phosphatase PAP2 family protein [Candidatus Nanoarchaeia archaeon]|nr:phosphatase PAP2 family protein [Candidatus Nanoarchaeia archaeon]